MSGIEYAVVSLHCAGREDVFNRPWTLVKYIKIKYEREKQWWRKHIENNKYEIKTTAATHNTIIETTK